LPPKVANEKVTYLKVPQSVRSQAPPSIPKAPCFCKSLFYIVEESKNTYPKYNTVFFVSAHDFSASHNLVLTLA